jgi:hypothetical protein
VGRFWRDKLMKGKLERTEKVIIEMVCNDVTAETAAKINTLFKDTQVKWGPKVRVFFSFDLSINYYNIIKQLTQIEALLDTGQVEMVSTKELIHAKCLVQDFFCKIEKLEQRLKNIQVKNKRKATFP